MFDNLMDVTPPSSLDDELQRYLATDVEDMKDRLMWWHERRALFPRLSHMARDYLSIPGKHFVFFVFLPLYYMLKPSSRSHNCRC